MNHPPQTWHHGIVAQHWAAFHHGGPEIPYYQKLIERFGQPALDVACGTGRLLLPYRRAGLDVDGVDISADMVAQCRAAAERENLTVNLYLQPMHELNLPRRYRTIYVCGSFGIGSTRAQDAGALARFHAHLAPGGVLLLDHGMPYGEKYAWHWEHWLKAGRERLDPDWWPEAERERAADGTDFVLRSRIADVDPLEQRLTLQMWAQRWQGETLLGEETLTLTQNLYFKNELLVLLARAGFVDIAVQGDYTAEAANRDHADLIFIARKEG